MITVAMAATIFKNIYQDRIITAVFDYDSKWFLFEAPEKNKFDQDSPYFAVNKLNGEIRTYSPVADLDAFTNTIYNKRIKTGW